MLDFKQKGSTLVAGAFRSFNILGVNDFIPSVTRATDGTTTGAAMSGQGLIGMTAGIESKFYRCEKK